MLLARYGLVFRDLLERETTVPRWRELVGLFRRMEARGEVRGGRFVSGFGGEQFALPAALDSLREARRSGIKLESVTVAAADPLNLIGTIIPGEKIAAVAGNRVTFDEAVLTPRETSTRSTPHDTQDGALPILTLPLSLPESNYGPPPTA
jgi:ATP-dependent Lhr-like helicase